MDPRSWEWECTTCTFLNTNIIDHAASSVTCQMCLIEQRRRPFHNNHNISAIDGIEKQNKTSLDDEWNAKAVSETTSNCLFLNDCKDSCPTSPMKINIDEQFPMIKQYAAGNQTTDGTGNWDAFASLQANYESSSDEEEEDGNSEERECSDNDDDDDEFSNVDGDRQEYQLDDDNRIKVKDNSPKVGTVECIDLIDSDEDKCVGSLSGKENEKKMLRKTRVRRRRSIESDSDSSLSEEDSPRPINSLSARGLSSWRPPHSSSSALRAITNGSIKRSDEFACMTKRNDITACYASPCLIQSSKSRLSKVSKQQRKCNASTDRSASKKTVQASAKRSSTTTTTSSSKVGVKAQPIKRRRGGGKCKKRSSRKRSCVKNGNRRAFTTNNGSNNVWSERERGIRQPYRRVVEGGSSTGTYNMTIAKQEPMLRNVGGASIQF